MFADPKANGLSCFAPLPSTANQELRPGDIIANTGHVVMVDRTGADPLGIRRAKSVSECASLTSSGFDFTIIQSSPSKGGIGMNRYRASSYLSGSMRTGMEAYARSFCRARFEGKTETLANKSQAVVIRHTGTPACQDKQMPIIGESCLASCAPNPLLAIR